MVIMPVIRDLIGRSVLRQTKRVALFLKDVAIDQKIHYHLFDPFIQLFFCKSSIKI
jgi:hypothetical protein